MKGGRWLRILAAVTVTFGLMGLVGCGSVAVAQQGSLEPTALPGWLTRTEERTAHPAQAPENIRGGTAMLQRNDDYTTDLFGEHVYVFSP